MPSPRMRERAWSAIAVVVAPPQLPTAGTAEMSLILGGSTSVTTTLLATVMR